MSRSATVEATVAVSSDAPADANYVLVSFLARGERVEVRHYYDKSIYKYPNDFCSTHPRVTIKYDPDNVSNYLIVETTKGDYTNLVVAVILGVAVGALAAQHEHGDVTAKLTQFLQVGGGVGLLTFFFLKIMPYLSFLNGFSSKDENKDE